MKVLGEKIVTKLPVKESETESGIILAGGGKEPQVAEVVGVGPNAHDALGTGTLLEPGDMVVFNAPYVAPLEIDGEEYLIFDPEDLVAVL